MFAWLKARENARQERRAPVLGLEAAVRPLPVGAHTGVPGAPQLVFSYFALHVVYFFMYVIHFTFAMYFTFSRNSLYICHVLYIT